MSTLVPKPDILYHGSAQRIDGPLTPILVHASDDHLHTHPAVFATERKDLASLFMIPSDALSSIGFEQGIAYICIWGTAEEFKRRDVGGFVYALPGTSFEKVGKAYEWQTFESVTPVEVLAFPSVVEGMLSCGAEVYFIHDDATMDAIVANKNSRAPILRHLVSENARQGRNSKEFVDDAVG